MSGRCLKGVWNVSGKCLEGVWKVPRCCLEGALKVFGGFHNVLILVYSSKGPVRILKG